MDNNKYKRVINLNAHTPKAYNEVRITSKGKQKHCTNYAINLLQELNGEEIVLKAMDQAISKAVIIAEDIKNRVPRLHQDTTISSTYSTHVWEPIEEGEGLLPVEKTFRVSMISITLSTKELNKSSPGYQAPAHDQQTRSVRPQNRYQSQQFPPSQPRGFYNDGGYEGSYGIGWGRGQGTGTNWSQGGYVTYVNYQGYIGYSNYGHGGGPTGWGYPGAGYGVGGGGVASRGYGRGHWPMGEPRWRGVSYY